MLKNATNTKNTQKYKNIKKRTTNIFKKNTTNMLKYINKYGISLYYQKYNKQFIT